MTIGCAIVIKEHCLSTIQDIKFSLGIQIHTFPVHSGSKAMTRIYFKMTLMVFNIHNDYSCSGAAADAVTAVKFRGYFCVSIAH